MASANKNAKSQLFTVRVPHEVVSGMELLKRDGESSAGFIVSAMQGEIARRQASGSEENPLLSSLDALARAEEIGTKAGEEIQQLVSVVRDELQRRKAKSEHEG
ncbi:YlcI/YnfO family protein [Enterobacter ludwigii]|uniref:YlcI/YnfO family protein n=1 Tax=Enterobacter ludwigii TaxID=299767 RepID=UPI003BEF4041